jgi:hypothetical protein
VLSVERGAAVVSRCSTQLALPSGTRRAKPLRGSLRSRWTQCIRRSRRLSKRSRRPRRRDRRFGRIRVRRADLACFHALQRARVDPRDMDSGNSAYWNTKRLWGQYGHCNTWIAFSDSPFETVEAKSKRAMCAVMRPGSGVGECFLNDRGFAFDVIVSMLEDKVLRKINK